MNIFFFTQSRYVNEMIRRNGGDATQRESESRGCISGLHQIQTSSVQCVKKKKNNQGSLSDNVFQISGNTFSWASFNMVLP